MGSIGFTFGLLFLALNAFMLGINVATGSPYLACVSAVGALVPFITLIAMRRHD